MTTKTRYFVILSLSILTVGVGTGLTAYYVGFPAGAVPGSAADELRLVSSKAVVVAYADVQRVMTSELRQRLRRSLPAQENGQREFQNLTGINIETDITHVIAFIEPDTAASGLVLASGLFDEVKIESLMREHGATVETYKDKRLIVAVPGGGRLVPDDLNWIFLRETDDFQAAFGELITAVKTDFAWVEFHRRLQVKALEWQRADHENSLLLRGRDLQTAEAELSINSSKEPSPTDLQRDYLLKSRQASDRQRRLLLSVSIGAAVVMAGLAVFGFLQAKLATDRANVARAGELAAQAVSNTINNLTYLCYCPLKLFAPWIPTAQGMYY